MKKWSLDNPNFRFALVMGAAMGLGQGILRGATENLGTMAGLVVGAAATALLAVGFSLILEGLARSKRSTAGEQGASAP